MTSASVNKGNILKVRAEKVGEDTVLSKIIKLVRSAGTSKAPIERTVDKIAGVFVPVVLLIALVTFIVWVIIGAAGGNVQISRALNMAISVLVISCPCALGLATPWRSWLRRAAAQRSASYIRTQKHCKKRAAFRSYFWIKPRPLPRENRA